MDADAYVAKFKSDIRAYQESSERTLAKNEGQIGASDFVCRERMRRIITRSPETDSTEKWAALVGSALDDKLREVRASQNPNLIFKAEWPLTIDGRKLIIHPDEVDPDEPSVTDYKSKDGLAVARAGLMGDSNRIQRHLQYLAGYKAGLLPAEGIVRNLVVDRSGKDTDHHCEQERFDVTIVEDAASKLRDVHYAIENDEEASKDWPRSLCRSYCPYFTACRGGEIDQPLIDDPDTSALVDAYGQAKALRNEADQLMAELKPELDGVQGKTATHSIYWIQKNGKTPTRALYVDPLKRETA